MIGKTLLHYNILEKLGQGGMGVVYKAQDNRLNRPVAIKFLPELVKAEKEEHQRFKIEAQAAAGLNHHNITTIYAIEETEDVTFIAMEYVEGQELRHFIRAGDLAVDEIVKIGIQIADGLQAAHEQGIIHRDIKSANIMLNKKGRVKIMDFGLAKVLGHSHVTKAGTTLGTMAYMSPEQSRGEAVDARSDIWSLGVVLYEMLTGKLPFRGDYEAAILYAILNEQPLPIEQFRTDVPPELSAVILKALQKNPDARYQNLNDMLDELYALQPNLQLHVTKNGADKKIEHERRPSSSTHLSSSQAERRQITSLYCRLIPLSPLDQVDPEELHDAMPAFYDVCDKVVNRYDDHIAPSAGEGVQVFFGYPHAHEDDARRAAMAGLAIIESMQQQAEQRARLGDAELAIQVGVHTGMVVFGLREESGSQSVVGDVPEIATKLAGMAPPNSVLASKNCLQLIENYFEYEDLGEQSIIGLVYPLQIFQILHQSTARSRVDNATDIQETPLIGRRREFGLLQDHWELLKEDQEGRVVCLNGEAGLGKSRLLAALKSFVQQDARSWLTECQCSAFFTNTPLYPIVEFLERVALGFDSADTKADRLKKIEGFLVQYGLNLDENVPLFANLLSVPFSGKYKAPDVTPERQKQMTYDALIQILVTRAAKQPTLFVVEDLHWADPSTLELLTKLVELGPTTKIFALFTYRPDFSPPWPSRSHVSTVNLMKLKQKDVLEIINSVTGGKELPNDLLQQIIEKTDGVPLFVEQLTRSVIESSSVIKQENRYVIAGNKSQVTIPATLRDSLTSRLDRLGSAKEIAQLGSVIGREFSSTLLKKLTPIRDDIFAAEIAKLVDAELVYQSALKSDTFVFKHALIQDAAYESILKKTRYLLHNDIAKALLELQPDIADVQPETLAHHYTAAHEFDKAIPLWLKAGQMAYARSTNQEAIAYYRKGLDLLTALPETPEGLQQELMFQLSLGMSLIAIKGYTDPDVETAFARARTICEIFGEAPQLFPALWGLWAFYIVRREFDMAHQLGDEMMRLAEQTGDEDLLLEAHTSHGLNFMYSRAEFETSRFHFEKAVLLYSKEKHAAHAAVYLQDPGVVATAHLAWVQWILGDVDDALQTKERVVALGEELGHPYSLSYALTWAGVFEHFRLEPKETLALADRVLAVASENIFPNWIADGDMIRGWALARLGNADEGIEQLQRGIAMWHAIGARLWQTHTLGLLADAFAENNRVDDGLKTVDEALQTVKDVQERYYEAELWRLKGELLLKQSAKNDKEAEACFIKAKAIASEQKATMFELRATVQLAALWQKNNKEKATRELESVLQHINQGQDSTDVKRAQALLNELKGMA